MAGKKIRLLIEKPAVVFIGEARENQLPISLHANSRQFAGKTPLFIRVVSATDQPPRGTYVQGKKQKRREISPDGRDDKRETRRDDKGRIRGMRKSVLRAKC